MIKKEIYNVYGSKDYYVVEKDKKKYFEFNNLLLEICSSGYIPKSGLLFDRILNTNICNDKKILDLGCGYLGIISLIARFNGAKFIDAVDYDKECVDWFKKIVTNHNIFNINCFCSNWFSNIKDKDYNIILSNPPQMPMLEDALHDAGGKDGRKFILEILENAIHYLSQNGSLFMLVFDFLGTNQRTNNELSIFEIAKKIGYKDIKIILETTKKIKKNSVTYNKLDYIKQIYPLYDFRDNEEKECKIQIISMRK